MDFRGAASYFIIVFNLLVLFYFLAINSVYLVLFAAALVQSIRYSRRRRFVDLYEVFRSPLTPTISILVPAFNEEATIVESVRSMLLLRYPHFEVVVINDGSTDRTLEALASRYGLRKIAKVVPQLVDCAEIRGVYISPDHDNLVVVDKENGGKSDALNAGINVSRHELVCVIDADSIIEPEGLLKVARPFIENPQATVAVGGLVRIVNGCKVEGSNVTEVRLPSNFLANVQIVEYLRAFLGGRIGWSALRCLLIISGAFGLFDRKLAIDVGGYRQSTVGEDMDLVVRMHHYLRKNRLKYRLHFVPDPVCWTEAPQRYRQLSRQRDRWQRGLIEALSSNITMLLNPRYGAIGLFAMPYYFFFEMIGPVIELVGYFAVILGFVLGMINVQFFLLFLSLAFLYAIVVSLFAVLLEGIALQHYPRIPSLLKLASYSIMENFGYRQVNAWWRTKAFFTLFTRRKKWGEMERAGFEETFRIEAETEAVASTGDFEKPVARPVVAAQTASETGPKRRLFRPRYALLLLITVVLAIVLPLTLVGRGVGNDPTAVEMEGVDVSSRASGRYLQVHTKEGWNDLVVKGVNVGTALPGKWFSEFPADAKLYRDWFEKISATGANAIRIYTLLDPVFYSTLEDFNRSHRSKLMLLQEIWPDDEVPNNNLFDEKYTSEYREEISKDIEALLGKADIPERKGRAWGKYEADMSPYVLGVLIGRELVWEESSATNSLNPDKSGYEGDYVMASGDANAVETWLAETCDYAVSEMHERGWQAPVSFVSWPTLDPMTHPTEATPRLPKEEEHEDTEELDPNHIRPGPDARAGLFACYHIYPYYPDFMNREPVYAEYRDDQGVLRYGGYLDQFMEIHPGYPALMGEFGISTSMGLAHLHPEGFHHGGVCEKDQGIQIARMYRAMLEEGFAGGVIFEWADEWAKRTWVDMDYMIPYERHIYWHNMMDPEQNFGIMSYEPEYEPFSGKGETVYRNESEDDDSEKGGSIRRISLDHNEAFFYLRVELHGTLANELEPASSSDFELSVGLDTFGDENGTRKLPVEGLPDLPTGCEFLLKLNSKDGGLLLARPDYDRGQSKFAAAPADDPEFVEIKLLVNREQVNIETGEVLPAEYTNDSKLYYGNFDPESDEYYSLGHWYVSDDGKTVDVRLPWLLLNVSDPSSLRVLHDERTDLPVGPAAIRTRLGIDALGTRKTGGFLLYVAATEKGGLDDFQPRASENTWKHERRYRWPAWDEPAYRQRLKKSYPEVTELFDGDGIFGQ